MKDEKKGFIIYSDLLEKIAPLEYEQCGRLFVGLLCSQSGKELPEMDSATQVAFHFVKCDVERNNEKYRQTCERRREAGKKGGQANASKMKQNEANESKEKQNEANASKTKQDIANQADNGERRTENGEQITENGDKHINAREGAEKKQEPVRHFYGQYKNVLLSDDDVEKLKAEFPADWEQRIEELSSGIAAHGYKYKNHLAAIRNWARRDTEKKPKQSAPVNKAAQELEEGYDMLKRWAEGS